MKLRHQFVTSMVIFSVVLVIMGTSVIMTNQRIAQLNDQVETSNDIQTRAGNLAYLSNEYFLYEDSEQLKLWYTEYSAISNELSNANATNPEYQKFIDEIKADLSRLNTVFTDVLSILERTPRNVSLRIDPAFQTIWNGMEIQNQELISGAKKLDHSLQAEIGQLRQINLTLIIGLLGTFGAYFVVNYLIVFRRTLKSISKLQTGIEITGSGNLDYLIETKTQDEIGELSNAFNQMTANLKNVTTSKMELEKEVAERRKAEEALKESQHDLNHAQAVAKTGSWRLDVNRNVLQWSDENHIIFGIPKGTPMTYETFLRTIHPDDRAYVDEKWKAGLQGEPYDIEHRIIVSGEVKWVREKAELEFMDGKLLGGFGTTQDVTERKRVQELLEERTSQVEEYAHQMEQLAQERLEKLKNAERLAAIGQTAGMVGHDNRNPLQAIIGDVYIAKQDSTLMPESPEKDSVRESLLAIEKNTEYINKIVQDLQDFAKPLNPCLEETDVKSIIDDCIAKNGLPENIKVISRIENEARKIIADHAYVQRILGNLVSNSVQAMPNGGKLTINAQREIDDIVITVGDTGVGIPEVARDKLFTPLFTTKSKGQGFGLAVVKRLTEALNGTVAFESQQGKGTKFIVKLPQKL